MARRIARAIGFRAARIGERGCDVRAGGGRRFARRPGRRAGRQGKAERGD
jgi:hypothetical protein